MIRIRQALYVIAFAMLFQAWAVAAAPLKSIPLAPSDKKLIAATIEAFAGKARTLYYADPRIKQKALISDRILDGFQAAPKRLTLKDGTAIYWGFRYKEATTRSVAIFDAQGRPRLLAAVDSIPWCDGSGRHCEPFISIEAFQASARRTFLHPGIAVFVRDQRDLETYLPYLKRWLHAHMLGFNVDCKEPGMAEACKFVTQTEVTQFIPIRAYFLPSMRPIELPKGKAADLPLEAF
ncbi:MAG: hypothetical protein Q8K01_10100 [Sulfurimicrobium sp.]|nr:hypothetical protein [Sulfurimicrobium sp.]MDP2198923.1 hypothetical protein [Sulfurimicrobium sp.]